MHAYLLPQTKVGTGKTKRYGYFRLLPNDSKPTYSCLSQCFFKIYAFSKVRKSLPSEFAYIIEELLHESSDDRKQASLCRCDYPDYYRHRTGFRICRSYFANSFNASPSISSISFGDIFDRGPGAHIIMDTLTNYHNWDIQWGNHDILWMGAAAGKFDLHCKCAAFIIPLCQYANFRGRIWHQYGSFGYLCHGNLFRWYSMQGVLSQN